MRIGRIAYSSLVLSLCAIIAASSAVTLRNLLNWQADSSATYVVAAAGFQLVHEEDTEDDDPPVHHIEWQFVAYSEPDFTSTQVASFSPQAVTILSEVGDGWALIEIPSGEAWIYLHDNLRYLNRVMGLFEDRPGGDFAEAYHIDIINPQLVRILDQDGDLLQIETWLGPKWIDLNFMPPRSSLDEFMAQFGGAVSIYYKNLETGFEYTYNPDRTFFGASMIKAPYILWVFLLAEAGYTSMDNVHTYTAADYWGGSGIIQHMNTGATFTERELARLALYRSDNIAFRMLARRIHGVNGFRDWVEEIGGDPSLVHTVTYSHMTAYETGRFAREIHNYLESGGRYSEYLRQNLLDNRYAFIVSDYPVASKSGWTVDAMHDMAIVYAPSPYILVIMTGTSSRPTFRNISMHFQHFNDRYFVGSMSATPNA